MLQLVSMDKSLIRGLGKCLPWYFLTMNLPCSHYYIINLEIIVYALIMTSWPYWMGRFTNSIWRMNESWAIWITRNINLALNHCMGCCLIPINPKVIIWTFWILLLTIDYDTNISNYIWLAYLTILLLVLEHPKKSWLNLVVLRAIKKLVILALGDNYM